MGGLGTHIVKKLTEDLKKKNHHVFFDNFFTSYQLLADLGGWDLRVRDSQEGPEGVPTRPKKSWSETTVCVQNV